MSDCSAGVSVPPVKRFIIAARTCSGVTPGGSVIWRPSRIVMTAPLAAVSGFALPPPPSEAELWTVSPPARGPGAAGAGVEAASCCITCWGSRPSTCAAEATSRWVRSAALGIASTPGRWPTWISTSVFIPGLSRCPGFRMFTSTGNIVTFWLTVACGSILSTAPWNGRLAYASTVMVTGMPGCTLPTSVSSTIA